MPTVALQDRRLLVDGHPVYISGGEIQYFRLPRAAWRDCLATARAGGLNTVTSYMPWYWHEPTEGQIDLTGRTRPECDLRYFLDLAAKTGLWVVARPGPFVNSELRWGGFPKWLFRDHPETMSRKSDGAIAPGRPLPAEGEPRFRHYVRRWYEAVVPLLAEYDAARGGPIILFQPDNELSAAWSYGLLNSLYDPTVLAETWPAWLARTYASLDALNRRYGTAHRAFTDVQPPRAFPHTDADSRLCVDWLNFKRWFFADYGATLATWARELGITVPMIFNEPVAGFYGHGDHSGFGAELARRGFAGATACHTYADRILDLDGQAGTALGIELAKSSPWAGPALSIELNVTWHQPRLSRSEINWDPLLRLCLGRGLAGTVVYPYAAGWAPEEDTIDGPLYWDSACIGRDGKPGYAHARLNQYSRFAAAWEPLIATAEGAADVTLVYTPAQRLLDFLGAPTLLPRVHGAANRGPGGERFTAEPVPEQTASPGCHDWLDGYENVSKQTTPPEAGLARRAKECAVLLSRLNLGYDMLDLVNPSRRPGHGVLIVPCTGCLETEAITYLLRHLDLGGSCLFFPTLPVLNLDHTADRRLADRLGVSVLDAVRPAGGEVLDYGTRRLDLAAGGTVAVNGWILRHRLTADWQVLARFGGEPVVAVRPCGAGRVLLAGIDATFTSEASLQFWQQILTTEAGARPAASVSGDYVHALVRRGQHGTVLTVLELCGRPSRAQISVTHPAANLDRVDIEVELQPHEARCLVLGTHLGRRRLLGTSSELIPAEKAGQWLLCGASGTAGSLVFAEPAVVQINGHRTRSQPLASGGHQVAYTHPAILG